MYLVGTDGGLLDKPYPVSTIIMSPGERVDILIKASNTKGSYKFLSLPYSRMGNMTSAQITLLTMSVTGTAVNNTLPPVVNPMAMRMDMDTSMLPKRTLTLSMGQGRGYINGMDFDVEPYTIMSHLGHHEVWEIVNNSNMDHPFHQHVNAAQILSIEGGDASYNSLYTMLPAWKDVIIIPKFGKVTMLVPVEDYDGMTMFHCHILEHEDIGMMGMWHIMDGMPMPMEGEEGAM
jgi:FtsP/CotA-like multicopper oxidase with cupredoxin domain